jgi:hypothetical protein
MTAEMINAAAWKAAITVQRPADHVPAGWHTVPEIAEALGKSVDGMRMSLNKAVKAGRIERQDFYIPTPKRGVYSVPHYRQKME